MLLLFVVVFLTAMVLIVRLTRSDPGRPRGGFCPIGIDEFYLRPRKLNHSKLEHEAAAIIRGESAS